MTPVECLDKNATAAFSGYSVEVISVDHDIDVTGAKTSNYIYDIKNCEGRKMVEGLLFE